MGVSEDLTGSWLPKVLQRLSRQYPKVEVELEIGVGSRLFKMIETEELDLAVGGVCRSPVVGRRLWSEPLVWACSADDEVPNVLVRLQQSAPSLRHSSYGSLPTGMPIVWS